LPAAHAILQAEVGRFTAWLHRREMHRANGPRPLRWSPAQEARYDPPLRWPFDVVARSGSAASSG
jgi:hypothetical protein